MPNLTIQRIIYRNFVQRPRVNRALDSFGNVLNRLGFPYATGLTRSKAALFASNNPTEISKAREHLLASKINRTQRAIEDFDRRLLMLPVAVEKRVETGEIIHEIQTKFPQAPKESIEAAIAAKLSPEQILDLFGKIVEECGDYTFKAFESLPAALDKAKEIFTPDQIHDFFGRIVEKCGRATGLAFNTLPATLDKAKEILSPDQILDLFGRIVEKCGVPAAWAFNALPAALEAKLSPEQIHIIFGWIIDRCGMSTDSAFNALPAALEAKLSPEQIIDLFGRIVEKCGRADGLAFNALPAALDKAKEILSPDQILDLFGKIVEKCGKGAVEGLRSLAAALAVKLSPDQILDLFGKIVEKCGKQTYLAFNALAALFGNLILNDTQVRTVALARFITMLDCLTDYNREGILKLLRSEEIYQQIGKENFLPHYNLYMGILTTRKRLGFALLEGILEATKQGIIPAELTPEEVRKINRFIDQTHSFSPIVYKVYRAEGDTLLYELMPLAERMAGDELGKEEIEAVIKKYDKYDGLEFLFAVIQMAIPLSGTSFVEREEGKGLLLKMMEAGDLRSHVPPALRGKTRNLSLSSSTYVLREGEEVDLRIISPILDGLRSKTKAEEADLIKALTAYLQSDRSEAGKEKVRQILYRFASRRDLFGEKVDRLGSADYYTLCLLEEIFRDKDCIASILARAIDKLPPALLAADKIRITHPEALVMAINQMWQGKGSKDEKIKRLAGMTVKYQEQGLRAIAASGKLDPEIVSALNELLRQENQAYVSKNKMVYDFLSTPLRAIQHEKAKFELKTRDESVDLRLQMVKGIPYGMYGLNAGVCVAGDLALWRDVNFKLIAMIDEVIGSAVGFVQVYEVMINGQKYWTLPGINPSTEFIDTVNPQELYDKLVAETIELAKIAGISGIFISTNPTIHSNRSDIQKVIKEKKYPILMIPKVNWSRQPAYPFEEVFVVWEG